MNTNNIEERFSSKFDILENGCWIWNRALFRNGYGAYNANGKMNYAHRYSYESIVGKIPDKLTLDHLCRNRSCVNPQHLEPVTRGENVLRGESPCAIHARKTHCKHGHEYTEENTRRFPSSKNGRFCIACINERNRKKRERNAVKS